MAVKKRFILGLLAAVLLFSAALTRLEDSREAQGRQRLEDSVRRTAVSCYASQGFYPPSVAYMEENWGLQYEKERYVIRYEVFASNLMPDITVLEK